MAKRVNAHMQIGDHTSASREAREAIKKFPQSKLLIEEYIRSLAVEGNDREMFRAWDYYSDLVQEPYNERKVLESMAWGVIDKGTKSSSPLVRLIGVVGAYFGQDAKGVVLLQKSLSDYDAMVREVTLQLVSNMLDERLRREVLKMFRNEQTWMIKLRLTQAVGSMRIKEALPDLMQMIQSPRTDKEVRIAAIEAVAAIHDKAGRKEIETLTTSIHAGHRQLGCQFLATAENCDDIDLMIPLLKDSNPEVRAAALLTIGFLRPDEIAGREVHDLVRPLLSDQNEAVGICSAWVMTLYNPLDGQKSFVKWIEHPEKKVRIFASSALAGTGRYGFPYTSRAFHQSSDSYVRMNLALGLIPQQLDVEEACEALHEALANTQEKMMWKQFGIFRAISPSNVKRNAAVPQLPEGTDQLVRLEILNSLVIVKDPNAQALIKEFLEKQHWGVSATASAVLLMEGDAESVEMVEGLLEDPNSKIRVQAALILAMWGAGEKATQVLIDSYQEADKNMKERILEALGQVGHEKSLPFLVERMKEQRQTLRIIAAASLLRALYN
ncbi:MAG: HEAT repeat domain-containing protein [Chlamydiota bacterium]